MENAGPIPTDQPLAAPPPGMVSDFSNPIDHQRWVQFVVSLAMFMSFSTLCALTRLYTRIVIVKRFGWDDGFAMAAMLLNIGLAICFVGELNTGLAGYDWNIRMVDFLANDAPYYNYYNAINSILFYFEYAFVKLSILALYLRVIGTTFPKFRIAVYVMMFAVVAIVVGCTIDLLTFCQPVAKLFHPFVPGTCNVNGDLFFAQAILTVVTDVVILVPPIPIIWKLSSTCQRKLGVLFLLCIGFLVTIISLVRTVMLSPMNNNLQYPLYSNFPGAYWALIEVNLAVAVACLPALPHFYAKIRGYSRRRSSEPPRGEVLELSPTSPIPSNGHSGLQQGSAGKKKNKRSSVSQIAHGLYPDFDRERDELEIEPIREKSCGEGDSVNTAEARSLREEQGKAVHEHSAQQAHNMV